MAWVEQGKPNSVLDVGVGFAKYGHLIREYSEIWRGNYFPDDWKMILDGIEPCDAYNEKYGVLYTYLYDEVHRETLEEFKFERDYDVILLCDVLEHLPKDTALAQFQRCLEHSKHVIVSTPYGHRIQAGVSCNALEEHACGFTPRDFGKAECHIERDRGKGFVDFCGMYRGFVE